ncbi:MAG: hypothetical protein Q9161_006888 [Pseudevernia consocians]
MRSFRSATTAFITIGFFALTTFSAPWNHPSRPPTTPPSNSGSTTSGSTTSGSTTSDSTTSGSDSSEAGSGTPGQATIVNKCTFPTYLYVCKQHPATCGANVTLAANTGTYSEPYAPASDGGHSMKISVTEGSGDILQFEYTNEGDGKVSYDLSEVNGNPFGTWGFTLTNTTTDSHCAPPATSCPAIFTDPTDGIPYTALTSDGVGAILCG